MRKIIVIGAGASGLMAAGTAAMNGSDVTLIERRERPARKLLVTGKGRCNLTNNTDLNGLIRAVPKNGRFLYSAFSAFSSDDTMRLFEELSVPLKTERGNRVFPKSDKAMDIVDALTRYAKSAGVKIITGRVNELITENGKACGALLETGERISADTVLIATGGLSYPQTGSTGDGYTLARQAGHSVTDLSPSLVPLVVHEGFCTELQGLSLRNITLRIMEENRKKPVYEELGELLFTHFGLSGPLVLSASAHIINPENKTYKAVIDLKPGLTTEQLDTRLLRDFNKLSNKDFSNALEELLPRKLIPVIVRLSGIRPTLKINQITKEMRQTLCALIKGFTLTVTGFRPVEEAVITRGGIPVKEVHPGTMESKLCKGLYFAGEVLDVDAYTGGFNLQIAFSTGHLAGISMSNFDE